MLIRLFRKLLGLQEYVSELDQFLAAYDKTHPRQSRSQLSEITKYAGVYAKRDVVVPLKKLTDSRIWKAF